MSIFLQPLASYMKILKFVELIGLLAILGGTGAGALVFGGFFSDRCHHPDPYIVNWALEYTCARPRSRGTRPMDRRGRLTIRPLLWEGDTGPSITGTLVGRIAACGQALGTWCLEIRRCELLPLRGRRLPIGLLRARSQQLQ